MKVDVFTPEDHVGDVIGDLKPSSRYDQRSGAWFSMEFSHYNPCPQNIADEVIAEAKARKEAK